ncbi:FlgD immunoglobulin-like domain containing protein [Desulfobacula sp.]|uniref:FlgD immunoglobulin-like domain containing protein n=1 Tax=Desulfobacula sp. TaxID=2593537 RepID=UPI00262B58A4|nr:FlgD immunoglobulin-like domain containing protein [Desulfobacula sp.]
MNVRNWLIKKTRPMPFIPAFLALFLWLNAAGSMASGLAIQNVQVDPGTLRPGESVGLSFYLNTAARVTIRVYTPDYNVIRHLITDQTRPAGINTVSWDGRDDSGQMVPNEAYLFGIAASGADGTRVVYDPTAHSGGEISDVRIQNIDGTAGKYNISYTVPHPSRISLQAGVHNGPLLKTLIDWQPMPAGEYDYPWDGMDETGQIQVMAESGTHLYLEGFLLPENGVIVQGSDPDYLEYQKRLPEPEREDILSHQTTRRSTMARINEGVSAQYLVERSRNVAPVFTVYLEGDTTTGLGEKPVTTVSGDTRLKVVVAPESMAAFNESRYEIIIFVDNNRFDEEEHAHTPYTYTLDTRKLSNGEHLITINQACLTGQVGAYSFKINVNN